MAVYWLRSFLHIIIIVELSRDSTRRKEGLRLYPDIHNGFGPKKSGQLSALLNLH